MSAVLSFDRRLQRNPWLLCAFQALNAGLLPIAILPLFLRDQLGLRMFHVFLLQSIFACAVALFEFPAGYLADRWDYRRVLLVAASFMTLGWGAYACATNFASVVLAELLLAVAVSLISGADTALLYETLLALGEEAAFPHWFSRYRALGSVAEGTAALIGAYLFVHWPRAPFALQAVQCALSFSLAAALVEAPRERGQPVPAPERVRRLLRFLAFGGPRLRAVVALFVALSLPSYVMIWVLPMYVEDAGVNAAYLGPIWAGASYTVAVAAWSAPRLAQRIGLRSALGACVLLVAVGYCGLGLTHAAYGFLFYFVLSVVRGLQLPLLHTEEQRLIPSSDRAALLSFNSLLFRATFMLVGPVVGYALDHQDRHIVLLGVGALLALCAGAAWLRLVATEHAVHAG